MSAPTTGPVPGARLWRRVAGRMPKRLDHVAPVSHPDPPVVRRRRQRTVGVTAALGGVLLGRSLSTRPGSRAFYGETLAVAAVWTGGALASGPLHLGWIEGRDDRLRRPVLTPVATGVGAFGVFAVGALVARRIPVLDRAVRRVLLFAEEGDAPLVLLTTLVNGFGEEVFFRGAVFALVDHRPVLTTTTAYVLVTGATGNPALVLAGSVMGTLFGLQRRASRGVQAPVLTHLTWSALMVSLLPRWFRGQRPDGDHRSVAARRAPLRGSRRPVSH